MADLSGSRVALDWHEEYVRGWGMAVGGQSRVLRPTTAEQIVDAFESARKRGSSVALRGAGCSYGDAAINTGGHVLDLSQMRRILSFDPLGGIARVEPA
jgi:decaprenylphospho-beta-D-ribofuranose 2-oxidase